MHLGFGTPDTICVECEFAPRPDTTPNMWRGIVWLRAAGKVIGNIGDDAEEEVGIAIGALVNAARFTGSRNVQAVQHRSAAEILDLVMWATYGEDAEHPELTDRDRKELAVCELLPNGSGPAFDGWQAALVESGDSETLIWRTDNNQVAQSHTVPRGTFWRAADQAFRWMRNGQALNE